MNMRTNIHKHTAHSSATFDMRAASHRIRDVRLIVMMTSDDDYVDDSGAVGVDCVVRVERSLSGNFSEQNCDVIV